MASIAGYSGQARWTWFAWVRRVRLTSRAVSAPEVAAVVTRDSVRARRHYPPPRDLFIERSALAREMYRL